MVSQMHSRTKTLSTLSLIVVVLFIALPVAAQQITPQSSNKSHRFLPPSQRPRRTDLRSPEYLEAFEQYQKLRRQQRSNGDVPLPFQPGQFTPEPLSADQSNPAQINLDLYEQLGEREKRLLRRIADDAMADIAKEISKDVSDLNRQFRKRLGMETEDESNASNPKFDLPDEVLSPFEKAKKTYREQSKRLSADYRQAMEEFKKQWPSEKIPPEEWLKKVQPFISSEVVEQLHDYRAYEEGKTEKLPDSAYPKAPTSDFANNSFSGRLLESVVKSLDSSTNQLLKRTKKNNSNGKKDPSLFKLLHQATTNQFKSINKSITSRTERYAQSSAANGSRTGSTDSSSPSLPSGNSLAKIFGAVAFVLGVAALIAYLMHLRKRNQSESYYHVPVDPDSIRDRESLLRAVHGAAAERFGRSSRYWHHRKLFSELTDQGKRRTDDLPVLAKLYERARYAPNGQVTSDDLEVARRWYKDFRDSELVKS